MTKVFFIKSSYANDWTKKVREENRYSDYELKFLELINAQDDEYILEIGAGEGRIGKELLKKQIIYIGVDISHTILTYANDELKKSFNSKYFLITADSAHLPFKPVINKVFAINTLFLCPDRYETLNNSRNILKSNGELIIDSINTLNLNYIAHHINRKIRNFVKRIANRFNFVRKLIKIIRKADYNPYFRPISTGNIIIYFFELKKLGFKNIKYFIELTRFQKYYLKLIPYSRIQQLIFQKILKYFGGRIILKTQLNQKA